MKILVAVSEEPYLQGLDHLASLRFIQKERGYSCHCDAIIRNAFREIEFWKNSGRKQKSDQLIDDVNGGSSRRHEQQRQNDRHGNRPTAGQKQRRCQQKSGELDGQQVS